MATKTYIVIASILLYIELTDTVPLSSVCEVAGTDTTMYKACVTEAQQLLKSRNVVKQLYVIPSNGTCGDPPSQYCILGHADSDCIRMCNSSDPSMTHSVDLAADDDLSSWWQSVSWLTYPQPLHITYHMSFNKLYQLTDDIIISFKSARPSQMILERSTDSGNTWSVWQRYAKDCQAAYGVSAVAENGGDAEEVTCSQVYSDTLPYTGGLIVFDALSRYQQYLGADFNNITNLYESYNATNWQRSLQFTDIRLRFLHPATDGGEVNGGFNLLKYYYAVSDIRVTAECYCNLHASECHILNGHTVCNCRHNTRGVNCEYCLPLYNNRLWLPAYYLPAPDGTANECQKCTCNEHTDSCIYNSTLGHGVCINCRDFTAGYFCHQCIEGYYINSSLSLHSTDVCAECQCMIQGTAEGDMRCDGDGRCVCKFNVRGDKCSHCISHFYGLELLGDCFPCGCSKFGVVPGSICDEVSGQCGCKNTTEGLTCSQCKDTYYSFPTSFEQECLACNCVVGASIDLSCNSLTGHCSCLSNITGRTCDTVGKGYYLPSPLTEYKERTTTCETAYIDQSEESNESFTGYNVISCSGVQYSQYTVNVGHHTSVQYRRYHLGVRYKTTSNTSIYITTESSCLTDSSSYNFSLTLSGTSDWMLALTDDSTSLSIGCEYKANITSTGPGHLTIDTLVLAADWTQFSYSNSIGSADSLIGCYDWSNSGIDIPMCRELVHSSMAELHLVTKACECDPLGTVPNTSCNPYGGQCLCRPEVKGRRCNQCKAGYHSMTSSGCQSCTCDTLGSEHTVCDPYTGQCVCKHLVASAGLVHYWGDLASRSCESCTYGSYNLSDDGCTSCDCSEMGSLTQQCIHSTGECECKSGVGGAKCDQCKEGYYGLSQSGCRSCDCDVRGSLSSSCDIVTGQCRCKENVLGLTCRQCVSGTFSLSTDNMAGCTPCYCYNHTDSQCVPATGFTQTRLTYPDISMAEDSITLLYPLSSYGYVLQMSIWSPVYLPANTAVISIGNEIDEIDLTTPGTASASAAPTAAGVQAFGMQAFGMQAFGMQAFEAGQVIKKVISGSATTASSLGSTSDLFGSSLVDEHAQSTTEDINLLSTTTMLTTTATTATSTTVTATASATTAAATDTDDVTTTATSTASATTTAATTDTATTTDDVTATATSTAADTTTDVTTDTAATDAVSTTATTTEFTELDGTTISNTLETGNESPRLLYTTRQALAAGDRVTVRVALTEKYWHTETGASLSQGSFLYYLTQQPTIHFLSGLLYTAVSVTTATNKQDVISYALDISSAVENCTCSEDSHTTGLSCELCVDGYRRVNVSIGSLSQCVACECNGRTSGSPSCHPLTGKCLNCRLGTAGDSCELCDSHVTGTECSVCEHGYWGLTTLGQCVACSCDVIGSVNNTCEQWTGRCFCKDNVQGVKCNSCQLRYERLGSDSCSACNECYSLAADKIQDLEVGAEEINASLSAIVNLSQRETNLTFTELIYSVTSQLNSITSELMSLVEEESNITSTIRELELVATNTSMSTLHTSLHLWNVSLLSANHTLSQYKQLAHWLTASLLNDSLQLDALAVKLANQSLYLHEEKLSALSVLVSLSTNITDMLELEYNELRLLQLNIYNDVSTINAITDNLTTSVEIIAEIQENTTAILDVLTAGDVQLADFAANFNQSIEELNKFVISLNQSLTTLVNEQPIKDKGTLRNETVNLRTKAEALSNKTGSEVDRLIQGRNQSEEHWSAVGQVFNQSQQLSAAAKQHLTAIEMLQEEMMTAICSIEDGEQRLSRIEQIATSFLSNISEVEKDMKTSLDAMLSIRNRSITLVAHAESVINFTSRAQWKASEVNKASTDLYETALRQLERLIEMNTTAVGLRAQVDTLPTEQYLALIADVLEDTVSLYNITCVLSEGELDVLKLRHSTVRQEVTSQTQQTDVIQTQMNGIEYLLSQLEFVDHQSAHRLADELDELTNEEEALDAVIYTMSQRLSQQQNSLTAAEQQLDRLQRSLDEL